MIFEFKDKCFSSDLSRKKNRVSATTSNLNILQFDRTKSIKCFSPSQEKILRRCAFQSSDEILFDVALTQVSVLFPFFKSLQRFFFFNERVFQFITNKHMKHLFIFLTFIKIESLLIEFLFILTGTKFIRKIVSAEIFFFVANNSSCRIVV